MRLSVIYYTLHLQKIVCLESDYIDNINEEVHNSFDGQVKISEDSILTRPPVDLYFALKF
jgi:hypothetical protein